MALPINLGIMHYDAAPPDVVDDLQGLRRADRFRFANELRAWIEVEDGRVVGHGYSGGGHIGFSTLRLGPAAIAIPAVSLPDLQRPAEVRPDGVRFVQTTGGRTGLPGPHPVPRKPFFRFFFPIAWTTLSLTLRTDGTASFELIGASSFPRHWVYDPAGRLAKKSAVIDVDKWMNRAYGEETPWGKHDSPALVAQVETALERELSTVIMKGKHVIHRLADGATLCKQGEEGREVYLLLDGILAVEVDGETVAEVGPGAVLGERATLEGGRRTASLRAMTACTVAITEPRYLDHAEMAELAQGHRREDT